MYTGASSSSSMVCFKKCDVFISFRGEDTRRKFTSHLYDALSKSFPTFIDENELQKGDEISSALIKAIEEANATIVVFSENYASSKWCLNELVKILECKKEKGQIVIPVFYEVDPSDVRNQRGTYRQAFEKHEQDLRQSKDKLQKWRNALTEAASLSGWHFQNDSDRNESDFIKDIVKDVLERLYRRHPIEVNDDLVGIEKKNNEVESLMKIGSNDVRTLGIWGMGGVGKTTLAKYVYNKQISQFERHCFLENVREESNKCGLPAVRKLFLSKLFDLPLDAPYVETPLLRRRLACEKSLIVFDDVATLEQAENLNIVNKYLGPGSRLMFTTRDMQICGQFDECGIYQVNGLNRIESLELFCRKAFRDKHPKKGYEEVLESAIGYCGGNPLALQVLGKHFNSKRKEVWESELEKLKKIPNRKLHDVLKLSFDDLDPTQQDLFLDIVCFIDSGAFNHIFDYRLRDYLMIVLLEACNFFAVSGLEVLQNKALITSKRHYGIQIHDLLVEMGREIVKQESPKHPGKRSRLWNPEEVCDVLKYNKGTEVVEVICLSTSEIEDLYLSSDSFKSMINLRYLHINNEIMREGCCKVHLLDGLQWLSDKLRHLYWDSFPLESLPSTFCAKYLVLLNMNHSKLKKLWDGIQKLDNLVEIDLGYSKNLIEIPDLSRAPNLRIVNLGWCESLCQLHPSVFTCPKLEELSLSGCKKIGSLKTNFDSKFLQTLNLSVCSSMVEFPVIAEEMTFLSLYGTAIHEFPSSMWRNRKLTYLDLGGCEELNIVRKKLSTDLGLSSLTTLKLSGCTKINASNLWFILDGMPSLKELLLSNCCNLETLPNNIQNNSLLEILDLDECSKLKSLPKLPASLRRLTAFNCTCLDINILQVAKFHFKFGNMNKMYRLNDICYLPGGHAPCEFEFHTTKASIDIPRPIPKSGLCGFIFCIVLSEGLKFLYDRVVCTIYENGKEIHEWNELLLNETTVIGELETLTLDHVLLCSWYCNHELVGNESGDDHYNLSFEFKYFEVYDEQDEEEWSTKGIKGCGVIPVYGLEHSFGLDGRSNSGDEIVELQSSAQISNEFDQHLKFDSDDSQNQSSTDEDESAVDQQEDTVKSKLDCLRTFKKRTGGLE